MSAVGAAGWSVAIGQRDVLHWLVVGFAIAECGEHFGVRWVDGTGRWRVRGSPRYWIGGAASVALRRLTR